MRKLFQVLPFFAVLLISGCAKPRLATRPWTPHEAFWAENMQSWYKDWEAPYYSPALPDQEPKAPNGITGASYEPLPVLPRVSVPEPLPELPPLPPAPSPAPAPLQEITYKVVKGDTLGKISQQFYGTSKKAKLIFEANKDKLRSPDLIPAGTVLKIPAAD